MHKKFGSKDHNKLHKIFPGIVIILVVSILGVHLLADSHAASPYVSETASQGVISGSAFVKDDPTSSSGSSVTFGYSFNYGFDLDANAPTSPTATNGNSRDAVTSALNVLGEFKGSMVDQSLYGFGVGDPEPNPVPTSTPLDTSNTNLSSLTSRIQLITNAGGIPVMTLVAAPPWMVACTNYAQGSCPGGDTSDSCVGDPNNSNLFGTPPCPAHYADFAKLSAYIAQQFPQIKYFVVWSEMRGFYNDQTKSYDSQNYTTMYNDVYNAIKKVRPDAQVGGPYINWAGSACGVTGFAACPTNTLSGSWGDTQAIEQQAVQYWLSNKVGADFIAMDGKTEIASQCSVSLTVAYTCSSGNNVNVDPVTASEKYAAIDQWVKTQTNLPIWWMESHIQPDPSSPQAWTDQQAAAARIATLIIMNTSGTSVGMQWDPQDQPVWSDEGLWTTTTESVVDGGGQSTTLSDLLLPILPLLRQHLTLMSGQPTGVIAATNGSQTVIVNTNNALASAVINGSNVNLTADEVTVK
jgi:hypothetical protein